MNRLSRRAWLRGSTTLLGAAVLPWPLAACSSEPLTRFQTTRFGTPCELLLWGPDAGAAEGLASKVWARLDGYDHTWAHDPAAVREAIAAEGRTVPATGAAADLVWRGVALDGVSAELGAPDLGGALLTLGQHLLALGERGYRPWHVGIPDPVSGTALLGLDLYAGERLVTVASYARYRDGIHAGPGHPVAPDAGAAACASCTVVVRGESAAHAAWVAQSLYQSRQADWRAQASALAVDTALWVGRDGQVEGTVLFSKRSQMTDQRRKLIERA